MKLQAFPNCCGINLLSSFGNTKTAHDTTAYTKEEVKTFILDNRKYSQSIQLIVLNEQQLKTLTRKLFKDLKFKISRPMYYPGHGNNLFILTYNPNGSKPK